MGAEDASIVGVWEVYAAEAPFPWHVMTFTPFGTVSQSNPHEGNQAESDSNGHGIWQSAGSAEEIVGKFVEFKADRGTGRPIGKGVVEFRCRLHGDRFAGTADAYLFDVTGELVDGPRTSTLQGERLRFATDPE